MLLCAMLLLIILMPSSGGASNPAGGARGTVSSEPVHLLALTKGEKKTEAGIKEPKDGKLIAGEVQIEGTATCPDFSRYTLSFAPESDPGSWTQIGEYSEPVKKGLLGTWDTRGLPDGPYLLKLTVFSTSGPVAEDQVQIGVDNNPPHVSISSPPDGSVVGETFDVVGTVTDAYLHHYKLFEKPASPLLLAHLDGSTVNERDGEEGTTTGEPSYEEAKFSQGLHVDRGQGLTYPAKKNIEKENGTVEMWVVPDWEEGDTETHLLLHTETTDPGNPTDCLMIVEEAGSITFTVYDSEGKPLICSVPCGGARIERGVPFHLGATWSQGELTLAVNGFPSPAPQADGTGVLSSLGKHIHIGFYPDLGQGAQATIDELSIYGYARPLTSIRTDCLSGEPKDAGGEKTLVSEGKEPMEDSPMGTVETEVSPGEALTLTLSARDRMKRESEIASTVFADNPSPLAAITSPSEGEEVEGEVEVNGIAFDMDLASWTLSYKPGSDPDSPLEWEEIACSTEPVWWGNLATWNTAYVPPGEYLIRLQVTDMGDNKAEFLVHLKVLPSVSRIEVTPEFAVLDQGQAVQFQAKGYNPAGDEVPIDPEWSCDPGLGEIDQTGLFTATGCGTGEVTATVGLVEGSATVQIRTYIGGTLTRDTTLYRRCNPYILLVDLIIPEGVTLTIEPGVVVKALNAGIFVDGTLIAEGASSDRIVMTSYKDDTLFGDTNNDGDSTGSPGDWKGITLRADSTESSITNTQMLYTGHSGKSAITVEKGSHKVESCKIKDAGHQGIYIIGGTPEITNSEITGRTNNGVEILSGSPTVSGCTIKLLEEGRGLGLHVAGGSPVIDSNRIDGCGTGIHVSACDIATSITSNTVTGCSGSAIDLRNSRPGTLTGNTGWNNGTNGIVVEGAYGGDYTWNAGNPKLPYVFGT
ncbi:MAG: right-handed parallel beta-helix repeat-containing protein, partial [Actinomycetia bacterium]|nr:right-handed parallel beta-helix repeat-containing protein [Actinomycetes bacterium]